MLINEDCCLVKLMYMRFNPGGFDGRNINNDIIIEPREIGEQSGNENSHQDSRNFRVDLFQDHHDGNSPNTIHKCREMGIIHCRLGNTHHGLIVVRCLVYVDPEKFGELRRSNNDGCGISETVNNRVGEKVYHHSQAQHTKGELEDTDNQGQHDGVGNKLR